MKIIAKPIEVISWFTEEGIPRPLRLRMKNENRWDVVKIDEVVNKRVERLAGNEMYVFTCNSNINGVSKKYDLKFEIETCKWMLFKIYQ